jgi:hypothetical protein
MESVKPDNVNNMSTNAFAILIKILMNGMDNYITRS